MCQVQAQLLATGADKCIYFGMKKSGEAIITEIAPDAAYLDGLAKDIVKFMDDVRAGNAPEPGARDYILMDDPEFAELARLEHIRKQAEKDGKVLKAKLSEKYAKTARIRSNGMIMYRSTVTASIPYAKIPEVLSLDLEKYRPKSRTQVTFKLDKDDES
jgi:hypothetical protein